MGFMDHLFSLRRRRKTATTNPKDNIVKPRDKQSLPHEQPQEEPTQEEQQQDEQQLPSPSVVALPPSSLASSSVNVDSLEFAESRDLVFLLGNTLDEKPDSPTALMRFPEFEYLLLQQQPGDDVSLARQSGSSLRSNRLFRALPVAKNDFRLSLHRPDRRGLKNARSTPNFDTVKAV